MINIKIAFVIWRSLFIEKYHRIKYFKDNIHKIFWGCLCGEWRMVVLLVGRVGECCSEIGAQIAIP